MTPNIILRSIRVVPCLFVLMVSTGFVSDTLEARATLVDCQSAKTLVGSATLKEKASLEGITEVQITLAVRGLAVADGKHGVHLHQKADRQPCSDAGGHFDPGPLSLFDEDGSAFIIHVNEDTFCPDGPAPGCAGGGRAACGVIEHKKEGGDFSQATSP